jgi:hypothetical protein
MKMFSGGLTSMKLSLCGNDTGIKRRQRTGLSNHPTRASYLEEVRLYHITSCPDERFQWFCLILPGRTERVL